ncbi:hypothetical protein Q669_20620 [Labrenzia sp. C1B10]|nr:hypothetical protein Q669_20620 [Labrenzia sp. C1B10]ERS03288.1 hypothetical protein Q675_04595 [Labrenzia sp. C1B70]
MTFGKDLHEKRFDNIGKGEGLVFKIRNINIVRCG